MQVRRGFTKKIPKKELELEAQSCTWNTEGLRWQNASLSGSEKEATAPAAGAVKELGPGGDGQLTWSGTHYAGHWRPLPRLGMA